MEQSKRPDVFIALHITALFVFTANYLFIYQTNIDSTNYFFVKIAYIMFIDKTLLNLIQFTGFSRNNIFHNRLIFDER